MFETGLIHQMCMRNAVSDWFSSFFEGGHTLFVTMSLIFDNGLALCVWENAWRGANEGDVSMY